MRKVCAVVASRANYGRLKTVLKAIQEHPDLELQLVVGASALLRRFGNVAEIIKADGFDVNARVHLIVEGETPTTMAKSTGLGLLEIPTVLENLEPDVVLAVADRFEILSIAAAASYMNIPFAHVQGGEVTGSIDESVRHAVTKLAHVHFPATKKAAERIIKMGERPETVFVVGCPAIDILASTKLDCPLDLFEKYTGVGPKLDLSKPYLLVLQHPVTTEYHHGLEQINETLKALHEIKMPTIMLWPNVDAGSEDISKGIRMYREKHKPNYLHLFINIPPEDYARVLNNAACIVGNSSSAIREGSFLGVPAVNIGTRQEGRERGPNVVDVGYDALEIRKAILKQVKHGRYPKSCLYGDGKAGKRIADILAKCDLYVQKKLAY